MEESIIMDFPCFNTLDPRQISALGLAYIGDAIYEVYVRSHVLAAGDTNVNRLHKMSTGYVSAKAQSRIIHSIADELTEEEFAVYKRGRNAHSNTSAKNADIVDYRHATGFETLIGYLFVSKKFDRMCEIINLALNYIDKEREIKINEGEGNNE